MKNHVLDLKKRFNYVLAIRILLICSLASISVSMLLSIVNSLILSDNQGMKVVINIGLIFSFVFVLLLLLSFTFMMVSVQGLVDYGNTIADGKLNTDDMILQENNYLFGVAKSLNSMKANMLFFADNTKSNVIVLSDSINRISDSMEMTCAENQEFAATVEDIANRSTDQLTDIKNITSKNDEVNFRIDDIAARIKAVENESLETHTVSIKGNERLQVFDENMKVVSNSITQTQEFILKLKESAEEIGNVVGFIVELNEQLNLLSLNASIEASKAGEAGKGFAVVASEITKLSQGTKTGVNQINEIVEKIVKNSTNLEKRAQKNVQELARGNEIFSDLKAAFGNINERNQIVLEQISDISNGITSINTNMKNNTSLLQNLFTSSENISNNTLEASKAIQGQVAEYQEITSAVNLLQNLLDQIQKLVARFDTNIMPNAGVSEKQIKIGFVLPVLPGVWEAIKRGVMYATKLLLSKNVNLVTIPVTAFDETAIKQMMGQCLMQGFDGIVFPGIFPDTLFEVFTQKGIPVVTYNSDTVSKDLRILFVGQNSYETGRIAATKVIEHVGTKANILLVSIENKTNNIQQRVDGFKEFIKLSSNCNIMELDLAMYSQDSEQKIKDFILKHNEIDVVYSTMGWQTTIAKVVEELNLSGKIKIIVHDSNKDILEYVKKGVITCAIGQDGFNQGYAPLIYLYNYLSSGDKPNRDNDWTRLEIIDSSNVKYYLD